MPKPNDNKQHLDNELVSMRQQIMNLEQELHTQREVSFAAGIFQNDVTVRILLESLAEGVVICDKGGRIILINRRSEELFGYGQDEVVGRLLNIFLPERSFTRHAKHIETYFKDPHIRPMGRTLDLTGKHKDGSEFPVEVSLSYLETEVGILGLAFVTDIAERKQAEWALKLKNEELDAFAHTVAHNLQSSLSALIGYAEVLADTHKTLSDSDKDEYITALARNGRRMSNIIDELLIFASIRKEEVIHKPLDMDSIVENTIQRLNFMIDEYQAKIILPKRFHSGMGYGPWIEEVWFNYLTNAVKYGGSPPVVEFGSEVQDAFVKFWVKDNGPGLTKNEQELLFKSYAQIETPKVEGHGLGLSIVKKIIEKLNGRVEVESAVGQGTIFSFYLARSPQADNKESDN